MTLRPLEEVYRLKCDISTESVVELETTKVTQAGTKGYKGVGYIVFAGELHAIAARIYLNVSRN